MEEDEEDEEDEEEEAGFLASRRFPPAADISSVSMPCGSPPCQSLCGMVPLRSQTTSKSLEAASALLISSAWLGLGVRARGQG